MPRKSNQTQEMHQFGIRLPVATMERAERLAPKLSPVGAYLTTTDVLRQAIERGLDLLEGETKAAEARVEERRKELELEKERAAERVKGPNGRYLPKGPR